MYQTEGLGRLFIQQSEVICNTDTPAKSVTDIYQTEETESLQTPGVVNKKILGVAEHYLTPAKSVTDIYQIKETRSLQTPAKQKETRSSRTLLI